MYSWRGSIILLSAVIVMAMMVVNVRHQARVLTVQLEQARAYEQQLQVEWSTRQVQQVSAAKNDKIAELVGRQDMQRVDPSVTYYMNPNASTVSEGAVNSSATNAANTKTTAPTASVVQSQPQVQTQSQVTGAGAKP